MRIAIASPELALPQHGNLATARRWAGILEGLGHSVAPEDGPQVELLIAIHAEKSAAAARAFRARRPDGPLVVALAGTDLYRPGGLSPAALETLARATRVVALQRLALDALPDRLRARTRVILQSADPAPHAARPFEPGGELRALCVGHLRAVKDPLLAADAARLLPAGSRVRIEHVGAALDAQLRARADAENRSNPRWRWLGPLPHPQTLERLARAHAALSTSRSEGGSNFLSEALALRVPPLVTAVPGNLGILGEDWPGAFPPGDARALAALLERFERDAGLRAELDRRTRALAPLVEPEAERAAWESLLAELVGDRARA